MKDRRDHFAVTTSVTAEKQGSTDIYEPDGETSKGRIQIQSESAEIFFRQVDLIPL